MKGLAQSRAWEGPVHHSLQRLSGDLVICGSTALQSLGSHTPCSCLSRAARSPSWLTTTSCACVRLLALHDVAALLPERVRAAILHRAPHQQLQDNHLKQGSICCRPSVCDLSFLVVFGAAGRPPLRAMPCGRRRDEAHQQLAVGALGGWACHPLEPACCTLTPAHLLPWHQWAHLVGGCAELSSHVGIPASCCSLLHTQLPLSCLIPSHLTNILLGVACPHPRPHSRSTHTHLSLTNALTPANVPTHSTCRCAHHGCRRWGSAT